MTPVHHAENPETTHIQGPAGAAPTQGRGIQGFCNWSVIPDSGACGRAMTQCRDDIAGVSV